MLPLMTLIGVALLAAAPSGKPVVAWDLTLEERIAMRVDPVKRAERWAAHAVILAEIGTPNLATEFDHDVIDGSRNPEVFLPHELFDVLIGELMPSEDGKTFRMTRDEQLRAAGFEPATFWSELADAASAYTALLEEGRITRRKYQHSEITAAIRAEGEAFGRRRCAARKAALARARIRFGPSRFDRFMYEILAPRLSVLYPVPASGYDAAWVRTTLGDCE